MRIYRMTATFGKLEQASLTLEPGLNVIEAPNEWGKTTWCTFLITMLYGLDTRAKSTKTALADKEKYAPWSGSPMAGRIDLNWMGRDITIERSTRGRTPMGIFQAYETQSGLAVPELTASNCGQLLLGVEQSVFRRTGFIRQSDLPVTQDDALRRRLNDLVTTGDESGDSDRLAAQLKELKNKCRYNRSGLLPQAESEKQELEEKLEELEALQLHSRKLRERMGETKAWHLALENHAAALEYAAAEMEAGHAAQARDLRDRAEAAVTALEQQCAVQPSREALTQRLRVLQGLCQEEAEYRRLTESAANPPVMPLLPEAFRGMTPEQAAQMVARDTAQYCRLGKKRSWLTILVPAVVFVLLGLAALLLKNWMGSMIALPGLLLLALGLQRCSRGQQERLELEKKYASSDCREWSLLLDHYTDAQLAYEQELIAYRVARRELDSQKAVLQKRRQALLDNQSPEQALEALQQMLRNWERYEAARREFHQAEKHLQLLQQMNRKPARKPAMEDALTYSDAQTQSLLAEVMTEQQRLQNRLGQYQGRMEALGDRQQLQSQLQAVEARIGKLEETYEAATLALETLSQARQALQRKFAPRISNRARELMGLMTAGRYDRLTLSQDLSLLAGAGEEPVLRETLWRSDGTMDQLYLALRLAVAEVLIPEAPLVLDDAFVRFDDVRLKSAMEILKELAARKQVIVFTCQHREKELLQ